MSDTIKFKIDGKDCEGKPGQFIIDAAKDNGVYIPGLCHMPGVKPAGSCRLCTVKINGRFKTSCTTPIWEGMEVQSETPELKNIRKSIIELMFVEGNHLCPVCEKSGSCDLQALGYKYQMLAPRFPYLNPVKEVEAEHPGIFLDRNRCILCKRCVRQVLTKDGQHIFSYKNRGNETIINFDIELAAAMTDEEQEFAMDTCPVGAILKKEKGYQKPIGKRKYDENPIGSDIEKK